MNVENCVEMLINNVENLFICGNVNKMWKTWPHFYVFSVSF